MGERSTRRTPLIVLGLLAATFVAYIPALSAGFIWDDNDWLTENPAVTGEQGWASIWNGEARLQYYPLLFSAFRVQHALWGLNPAGYHTVNVALHALTAILLGFLLVRLELRFPWWIAFAFALHPIQVESVAWVTELKNVLSGALVMGALLSFTRALQAQRWDPRHYGIALLLFVAAVLSKTAVATAAFVIPIIGYRLRGGFRWADLKRTAPFVAFGAVLGVIAVRLERGMAALAGGDFDFTWVERVLIGTHAFFFYIFKVIRPGEHIFTYPRWDLDAREAWVWPPLAALAIAIAVAFWFSRHRAAVPALAVYVVMIAPALGLFDVYWFRYSFVADHFAYLAMVGILILVIEGLGEYGWETPSGWSRVSKPVGVVFLIVLGWLTWNQATAYRDPTTLWTRTIEDNPDSWLAHHSLALEGLDEGRPDLATRHFNEALRCKPDSVESLTGRAMLLLSQHRYPEAHQDLDRALAINPTYPQARLQRGIVRARQGLWEEAIADLDPFLAANPYTVEALQVRAEAHVRLKRFDEGIADLNAAIDSGGPPGLIIDRGVARIAAGDLEGAAEDAELAKTIESVAARGWELDGVVRFRQGAAPAHVCEALRRACDLGECRVWQGTCQDRDPAGSSSPQ